MKKKIFSSLFCVVAVDDDDDDDNDDDVSSPPSLPLPPFSAKLFRVDVVVDDGKIRRRGTTISRNRVSTSLDVVVMGGAPATTT